MEGAAAGEDDVRSVQRLLLREAKAGRRVLEGRKIVHHVVDEDVVWDALGEVVRHRRVEPDRPGIAVAENCKKLLLVQLGLRVSEPDVPVGRGDLEPYARHGPMLLGSDHGLVDVCNERLLYEPGLSVPGES